jgi:ABC-type lipoprotein export system ATPase subunit
MWSFDPMSESARPIPNGSAYIKLQNVVKTFKSPAGEFTALKGISLGFDSGEFTAIMGKSGSGKSTLINMITGIDHPTSGVVKVGNVELGKMSEGKMAEWRGRAMGIVFQFFQLLPTLSILENTMLPMDYCNMYARSERETRAMDLLKLLGLSDMADKLPAALSGGQQQIAAIARALANDPPILVADEPTGNLDSQTEKLILDIFADLAARGKTILIVTHDPILAKRSTRRVLISDGEVVNEAIAHALGTLPHTHLLKIGRMATPRTFDPGTVIARQGTHTEGLIVITRGKMEVLNKRRLRPAEVVSTLGPGDYMSSFDMLVDDAGELSFRATDEEPLETLCIILAKFDQYVSENPVIDHAMRKTAQERAKTFYPSQERKPFWRLSR